MRYPATEKLEIIRLVEQSHLPVRRTLAKIGIPPTTFYRLVLSRICAGPSARLGHLAFEGQGAFSSQC
jgi:transposase-like protein